MKFLNLQILVLSLLAVRLWAGEVTVSAPVPEFLVISEETELLVDSTGRLDFEEVRTRAFSPMRPVVAYQNEGFNNHHINYWLRFRIRNNMPADSLILFFYAGWFEIIDLYQLDHVGLQVKRAGMQVAYKDRPYPDNQHIVPIRMGPGEEHQFFVRIHNIFRKRNTAIQPALLRPDYEPLLASGRRTMLLDIYLFNAAFLGAILFMFFFTLFQYFQNQDKVYLYYSAYLIGFFLYFLQRFEMYPDINILFAHLSPHFFGLEVIISMLSYVMYFLFVRSFLNLKSKLPRFDRFLRLVVWGLLLYIAIDMLISFLWQSKALSLQLHFVMRILLIPIAVYSIFRIYRLRTLLSSFIVTGSLFLLVGATIAMFSSVLFPTYNTQLWDTPLTYMQIGIALELLCFSLGLGYKSYLTQQRQQVAQKRLIQQLEENDQLQRNLNEQLEQEVATRTEKILRQSQELEMQRTERLQAEFNQKLAEAELKALQGQMNPHFLFNSLNSIKHFILTNDKFVAADYLTNFSRLVRLILNNSKSKVISLDQELETLRLYIEMEQLRFPQKFEYEIKIEPGVNKLEVQIPPLILQPYVENAIWHGLMYKRERGRIEICARRENGFLLCSIEDNGIGRKQAMALKGQSSTRARSFGMQITKARLNMTDHQANVKIIDLYNAQGGASGTRVEIQLPIT